MLYFIAGALIGAFIIGLLFMVGAHKLNQGSENDEEEI